MSYPEHMECPVFNSKEKDLSKLHVKQRLCAQIAAANIKMAKVELSGNDVLTPYQRSLFPLINNYQDLYVCEKSASAGEELRVLYCMHALNHVLKTRSKVIANNKKIKNQNDDVPDECRDQGFTRPKVLMVVPFRNTALKIVSLLIELLMGDDQKNVLNKKRLFKEYGTEKERTRANKPEDFQRTFAGNTDDDFCLRIGIAKKSINLFTKTYGSDIIIASPVGLRRKIAGNE